MEFIQYKAQQEQSNLNRLYYELKCLETDYKHLQIEKAHLEKEVSTLRCHPAFQQPKALERDEYVKEFYPYIWEMANDYTKHTKFWTPPTYTSKDRTDDFDVCR